MKGLAAAFEKAGIHPRDIAFDIAISKYLNSGGSIDGAEARLRIAADKVSHAGQSIGVAHSDRIPPASTSENNRDRGGQCQRADHGQSHIAVPAREPSVSQRRAAASVRNVVSLTVLDTFKIRDGRAIGDVRMGEVERLRAANAMEASIFRQIQRHAIVGSDARIRDVINPAEFQRIQQLAAEVSDAG